MYKSIAITLTALLGLSAAAPTRVELAPRCGTTYYPTILQQFSEDQPNAVGANTVDSGGSFQVQQIIDNDGAPRSRVYQLVAFQGIAKGSYGCQLSVSIPQGYPVTTGSAGGGGGVSLSVAKALDGHPEDVVYPNNYTWSNIDSTIFHNHGPAGTFGTVAVGSGSVAAVNSEACDESLAYLFEVAAGPNRSAAVQFVQQNAPLAGFYLTANC